VSLDVSEDEYYRWFEDCGYRRTGEGTELEEELANKTGHKIYVPRASTLSAYDRVKATTEMSKFFGWRSEWGAH